MKNNIFCLKKNMENILKFLASCILIAIWTDNIITTYKEAYI